MSIRAASDGSIRILVDSRRSHFDGAKAWRDQSAVLDRFNRDGYRARCHVPPEMELQAWEGVAAAQIDKGTDQFLEGGGRQLFVDLGLDGPTFEAITKAAESGLSEYKASNGLIFKFEKTGWKDSVGIHGFGPDLERYHAETEALVKYERQSKIALAGGRIVYHTSPKSEQQRK